MATCDMSFDEMAVALSYVSLGGGSAPAVATARSAPPAPAATKKVETPAKKTDDDDDVSTQCSVVQSALGAVVPGSGIA